MSNEPEEQEERKLCSSDWELEFRSWKLSQFLLP